MFRNRTFTKEQVYQKLKHYCAYQDRCLSEVKSKAFSFGLKKADAEELTSRLIEESYFNEEHYAVQFCGGKFKMKQWGRLKIKSELKKKGISPSCISLAIETIDAEKYTATLKRLAAKKWDTVKGKGVNHFVKMTKTRDFLLQRGFEPALINKELKFLFEKEKTQPGM